MPGAAELPYRSKPKVILGNKDRVLTSHLLAVLSVLEETCYICRDLESAPPRLLPLPGFMVAKGTACLFKRHGSLVCVTEGGF